MEWDADTKATTKALIIRMVKLKINLQVVYRCSHILCWWDELCYYLTVTPENSTETNVNVWSVTWGWSNKFFLQNILLKDVPLWQVFNINLLTICGYLYHITQDNSKIYLKSSTYSTKFQVTEHSEPVECSNLTNNRTYKAEPIYSKPQKN